MDEREKHIIHVKVVDWDYKELCPTHAGKAGRMLRRHKAIIYRKYPFTIRIRKVVPLELIGKYLKKEGG